jgi:hypothetical protein
MKNKIIYFFLLAVSIFMTSCKKQDENTPTAANPGTTLVQPKVKVTPSDLPPLTTNGKQTSIAFTEEEFDFGTVKQGDKVNHFFSFKNTGKNDLVISRAIGSCGCTVPEFPKEPIAPGKTGVMKVSFNSTGKKGKQQKTVSVYANVPTGGKVVTIKANIIVK